ncbi:MAG: hypothetical protein NTW19_20785 [Planctomycetota bacterium]|nr:hypothetical protein [Planctomycetota bacterium]
MLDLNPRRIVRLAALSVLLAAGCSSPPAGKPVCAPAPPVPLAALGKPTANDAAAPATPTTPSSPAPVVSRPSRVFIPDDKLALATRGLVSWWPFAGHAYDLAGTNHGELQYGACYTHAPGGDCLSCDHLHAHVNVGNSPTLNPPAYTFAAWIKSGIATPSSEAILSNHHHGVSMPSVNFCAGQALVCAGPQGGRTAQMGWHTPQGWTHLALVGDAKKVRIYVNGDLAGEMDSPGTPWANPEPFTIGASPSSLLPPTMASYKGHIADVMVFARTLPPEEVATLAQARNPGAAPVAIADGAARAAEPVTDAEFDALWADLTGASAPRAYAAVTRLARAGDGVVPCLVAHLALPAKGLDDVKTLIAQLDDDRWEIREAASRALAVQGDDVRIELRKRLEGKTTPEARARMEAILSAAPPTRADRLAEGDARSLRAVLALQRLGTPAATAALREIAADMSRGPDRLAAEAGLKGGKAP